MCLRRIPDGFAGSVRHPHCPFAAPSASVFSIGQCHLTRRSFQGRGWSDHWLPASLREAHVSTRFGVEWREVDLFPGLFQPLF